MPTSPALDIARLRSETPGCRTKTHFNNAGASLVPEPVVQAIEEYLTFESETGGYEVADLRAESFRQSYSAVARLLNAHPRNIAWTSSATNAFARAISSIPFAPDDVILTTNEDYASNQIAFLSLQKRFGIRLIRAATLPEGEVDVADMERLIRTHRPRLVSVTHVPTNTGLVQPIEAIGRICQTLDILYMVDACQSVGQLPLDVNAIGCDFLCATMRKFLRGPRGMGFLYVSDRLLAQECEPLFIDMHGARWTSADTYDPRNDAQRFQDWEQPYALIRGSATAIDYALEIGLARIEERNRLLCERMRTGMHRVRGARLLDQGTRLSSIITVALPLNDPYALMQRLRDNNVNISITNRFNAYIDFERKGVEWALRISPHYYNTEEEVDLFVNILTEMVRSTSTSAD